MPGKRKKKEMIVCDLDRTLAVTACWLWLKNINIPSSWVKILVPIKIRILATPEVG